MNFSVLGFHGKQPTKLYDGPSLQDARLILTNNQNHYDYLELRSGSTILETRIGKMSQGNDDGQGNAAK